MKGVIKRTRKNKMTKIEVETNIEQFEGALIEGLETNDYQTVLNYLKALFQNNDALDNINIRVTGE